MAFTGLWTRPERLRPPNDNYFHQFPALPQTQGKTEFPLKREGKTHRKKVTDVEHQGRHEPSN